MKPIWILEANVTGLPTDVWRAEIESQGMDCRVIKWFADAHFPNDLPGCELVPRDACAIFRGSIPAMRHIQRTRRWKPGGWFSAANFSCLRYYAHFGPYMLNRRYTILPCAEVARLLDSLIKRYGRDGELFIRPDAADKTIKGGVVSTEALRMMLAERPLDPTSLLMVSRPKEIDREWRVVIANGKPIGASQYSVDGGPAVAEGCPGQVVEFIDEVMKSVAWRPDAIFVADVCDAADELRIVELNSFSCSGLYDATIGPIVSTASIIAIGQW